MIRITYPPFSQKQLNRVGYSDGMLFLASMIPLLLLGYEEEDLSFVSASSDDDFRKHYVTVGRRESCGYLVQRITALLSGGEDGAGGERDVSRTGRSGSEIRSESYQIRVASPASSEETELIRQTVSREESSFLVQVEMSGRFLEKLPDVERLQAKAVSLLNRTLQSPELSLSGLFGAAEISSSLPAVLSGEVRPLNSETILSLLQSVVKDRPDSSAYICEGKDLTFIRLFGIASSVANELMRRGIGKGDRVGVLLERGCLTPSAILGIWMARGVYVPLDLAFPENHIRNIDEESSLSAVLTDRNHQSLCDSLALSALFLEEIREQNEFDASLRFPSPEDSAALLYTSGSTGEPKGVVIRHGQLMNRFHWLLENYPFVDGDVALQRTTVNFIPSLWEFFGAAVRGYPTVILPDRVVRDPFLLADSVKRHKISRAAFVPALLKLILESGVGIEETFSSLRLLFVAGEKFPVELFDKIRGLLPHAVLCNDYGATEVNGVLHYDSRWNAKMGESVPVGKPIANTQAFILDDHGKPLPPGDPGMLYIGGIPVPDGYWERPDLTEERFLFDSELSSSPLYSMGDIAVLREDGFIEIIGRKDHQVKLNGVRVELTGIESRLREIGAVKDAIVAARNVSGELRLYAFVVYADGGGDASALKAQLAEKLPSYMVPARFYALKEIPLLPNGKVDRRYLSQSSLPEILSRCEGSESLQGEVLSENHAGHSSFAEEKGDPVRMRLWKEEVARALEGRMRELLALEEPVRSDRNFSQYGLTSMDAVRLVGFLNDTFSLSLSPTSLYEYGTPDRLTNHAWESLHFTSLSNREEGGDGRGSRRGGDVAVIGISGLFPGADDLSSFWDLLVKGENLVREVPEDRWSIRDYYSPDSSLPGKSDSKWGCFLSDAGRFDSGFFEIDEEFALRMDPQQRIALEQSWNALEDAGYASSSFRNESVGIFMGVRSSNYKTRLVRAGIPLDDRALKGNDAAVLVGGVAHALNLRGPAISVDTACSSSLVAIHLACQSVLSGECDMALAGGVSVMATEEFHVLSSKNGMLSPTGSSRVFSEDADGFVPGEACGVLVLKGLEEAKRDGDVIHGVILGSATNHTGNSGEFTLPTKDSQKELIGNLYRRKNIDPSSIGYMELNATGTIIGDMMEVEALGEVFQEKNLPRSSIPIGSVKSNFGHSSAAAGVTGSIKALLSLKKGEVLPSLHFESRRSLIPFDSTPFYVNTEHTPWKADPEKKRRAAVSSFGYGGSNAHLVLEEYDEGAKGESGASADPSRGDSVSVYPVLISAKTGRALEERIQRLLRWIEGEGAKADLAHVAYTLAVGREQMEVRAAFPASSLKDLAQTLQNRKEKGAPEERGSAGGGGELSQLLDSFLKGETVDATPFFREEARKRVSLPGYPFAGGSFWITPEAVRKSVSAAAQKKGATGGSLATKAQKEIAGIWSRYLGRDSFRGTDRFMDLGGNSLLMVRVHADISKVFNKKLSIIDMFFKYPTLESLAGVLSEDEALEGEGGSVEPRAEIRKGDTRRLRNARLSRRTDK